MQLDKNQVQQIKYDLEKQNYSATSQEIRFAAESFETFDREEIGKKVLANHSFNNSKLAKVENNSLTHSQKQSLVRVEAEQLGVVLSDVEITQILDADTKNYSDSVQFLIGVRELIREFLAGRNHERNNTRLQLVSSIQDVIEAANQEDAMNVVRTNQQLMDIVNSCKQQATDYKSPYTNRLESIRETLQAKRG
ncbi:hypothetical protein VF14_31820 [Nostoc linckia z18]|uniref:Uncharacterized protein n=2 Tax=Nostoc linckia TaxID=92942 RepID=A0A9Q5Z5U5_NOSLI|nr:hypothetical protein [Nostoc linckia]PHK34613.1 hypothetical protein VF12_23570 [Nostoc linckia z15]PHK41176.1 hypothetical protein VF13_31675 [Nostoc linckia z16]PHJ55784.1 hypothetical protein VF02_35435 [Nostoc linckia z1]PHJ56998.1 hypothetical protein VF05_36455 [Nostoc linckia z3]PHJ58292.1 hypothetical protein VF03_35640 [Nostoc linckia z2]